MSFTKNIIASITLIGLTSIVLGDVTPAVQGCDLNVLKADKTIQASFKIAEDPVGLALEAKNDTVPATQVLANFAKANQCELYALPMGELVKGLLKGLNTPGDDGAATDSNMNNMNKKYILLQPRKAMCMRELNINLPVKKISSADVAVDKKAQK